MEISVMHRRLRVWLFWLLILLGLSGLYGGGTFLIDPSGASLHVQSSWLEQVPFHLIHSYVLPGIFLFFILGVWPIITAFGLTRRLRWADWSAGAIGLILTFWIIVEAVILWILSPIQLTFGLLGLLISGLGILNFML